MDIPHGRHARVHLSHRVLRQLVALVGDVTPRALYAVAVLVTVFLAGLALGAVLL